MMFKTYFVLLTILFVNYIFIFNASGENIKKREPIYISSLYQKFDMSKGIIAFIGMVKIQKGPINIFAKKIFFYKNNKERMLIGYGNPIIFSKLRDNKTIFIIKSMKIKYEINKNIIFLTGNVSIDNQRISISGHQLIYLIKTKKIKILGKKNERVSLFYFPKK